MSAKITKAGSVAILILMGVVLLVLMGIGLGEALANSAGIAAVAQTGGSVTIPVALLTGLLVLSMGAVRLAEAAISKLRKAGTPGGELANDKLCKMIDKMLERQAASDSEEIRALDKLQTSVQTLNQSMIALAGRFDGVVALLAMRQGQEPRRSNAGQ